MKVRLVDEIVAEGREVILDLCELDARALVEDGLATEVITLEVHSVEQEAVCVS